MHICLNVQKKNVQNSRISKSHKALIELIAEKKILFTQLESDIWENFIKILKCDFVNLLKDQLRKLIFKRS